MIVYQKFHGNAPGYDEDSCQTPGCEGEVTVDDFGLTLCANCAELPEYKSALNRAAAREADR